MARPAGVPIEPEVLAASAGGVPQTKLGALAQRLTGWMGPGLPMPVVAPAGTEARRFDYPIAFNTRTSPRTGERMTFEAQRALADNCWQLRGAIETRKVQIRKQRWSITYRDPDEAKFAAGKKTTDPAITAITERLRVPDRIHTWRQWINMACEDFLAIDACAAHPWYGKGGPGNVYALELFDGATIQRKFDDRGNPPEPPAPGVVRGPQHIAYQQVIKGVPAAEFTRDELFYGMLNPRTFKAFGMSLTEQLELVVNIAIRRELWRLHNYTEGSIPDALIHTPESWGAHKIAEFQTWWDSLHQNNQAAQHGARFIPGGQGMGVVWAKEKLLQDEVDEFLCRAVCWLANLPPTWAVKMMNRATAEVLQEVALEEGQMPFMQDLEDFMDRIISVAWARPDLAFRFDDPRTVDPVKKAQVISTSGVFLLNEARKQFALDPIEGGDNVMLQGGGQIVYTEDFADRPEPPPMLVAPGDPAATDPDTDDDTDDTDETDDDEETAGAGDAEADRTARAADARLQCGVRRVPVARARRFPAPNAVGSQAAGAPAGRSRGWNGASRGKSWVY